MIFIKYVRLTTLFNILFNYFFKRIFTLNENKQGGIFFNEMINLHSYTYLCYDNYDKLL